MNQCDGCRRGAPLVDGVHLLSGVGSYPGERLLCTADRYEEEEQKEMETRAKVTKIKGAK